MDFTILHFAIHIVWKVNVICICRKPDITRKTTVAYPELRLEAINTHDKQNTVLDERDSTVEKFREHLVIDSSGNVVLREIEHQKEKYKAKGRIHRNNREIQHLEAAKQEQMTYEQYLDGIYNASLQNVEEESEPSSSRWLWLIGFLTLLTMVGAIISNLDKISEL